MIDCMKLATLIEGLDVRCSGGAVADVDVVKIVEDSRHAGPGSLFVARPGLVHDGRQYIADAVAAGAVAVLSNREEPSVGGAAMLICEDVPCTAAFVAERFCSSPSRQLQLVGVTGTNGKTTTSHLVHHLLNSNDVRSGLIGTVQVDDGSSLEDASLTTPPALALSPMLRRMIEHGCRACVMEVSSHALEQQRTSALAFNVGVFTNISGDHLDYHESMEAYIAAKAKLFAALPSDGFAIINVDDPAAGAMQQATSALIVRCSLRDSTAECSAAILNETITHVDVHFTGPWGDFETRLPLCGRHNVMNALQAAAAGSALGLTRDQLLRGLGTCSAPPGRLEPVTKPGDPFAVYVDYAHTDDALENVLKALRPLVPEHGKLRVVFGCGGDRDRTKRPRMAEVACRYGDDVLVTSDNPRTEDPASIVEQVMQGVPAAKRVSTQPIVDRREAIAEAVARSSEGDVVLIAGKGHETYQIVGTTYVDFDDRTIAADALNARREKRPA